MRFEVPVKKDSGFATSLFSLIDSQFSELATEHKKIPSQIIFSGRLGKELHEFIKGLSWNFSHFELIEKEGPSQLVFKYHEPLDQVKELERIDFQDQGLDGRTVEGIIGKKETASMLALYASGGLRIEKKINPEKIINLIRKNEKKNR